MRPGSILGNLTADTAERSIFTHVEHWIPEQPLGVLYRYHPLRGLNRNLLILILGLTPQALCWRPLRELVLCRANYFQLLGFNF